MENRSFTAEQIHAGLDLLTLEYDTIRVRVHNKPCELICTTVENEYGPRLTTFFLVDDEDDSVSLMFRYDAAFLPVYDKEYIREADAVISLDYPALRITLRANGDVHIKKALSFLIFREQMSVHAQLIFLSSFAVSSIWHTCAPI